MRFTAGELRTLKAALERSIEYGPLPSDKGVAEMHLLGKIDAELAQVLYLDAAYPEPTLPLVTRDGNCMCGHAILEHGIFGCKSCLCRVYVTVT